MNTTSLLHPQLDELKLPFLKTHYAELAQQAAQASWTHVDYLARLIDGQYQQRRQHTIERRIKAAHFPVLKTLQQFRWDWPKSINRLQVQNLFRLEFLAQKANVIFLGNVGLGKTHLATALGYAAAWKAIRFSLPTPLTSSTNSPPPRKGAASKANSTNTSARKHWSSMRWDTCPSISTAPTTSFRSSASAMSVGPLS